MSDLFGAAPAVAARGPVTEIYVDLDGVAVDFYGQAKLLIGRPYAEVSGATAWGILDQVPHFFRDLPPLADAHELWSALERLVKGRDIRLSILSALPLLTRQLVTAPQDKLDWVRTHLSKSVEVNLVRGGRLKAAFAHPHAVLIDDLARNIDAWCAAGGIGIHHRNSKDTIEKLISITI